LGGGAVDWRSDRQTQAVVVCEVTSFQKYNKRADISYGLLEIEERQRSQETINKKFLVPEISPNCYSIFFKN
jgi:hypothetical protein